MRLLATLLILTWTTWAAVSGLAAESAPRPHVVFFLADDLGRADVGFMGSRQIQTPHIDGIAKAGAKLESFYVQPVCSPTRAALLTGRYATHTGVYAVVRPRAPWGLPLAERTLADALRQAGYETAISGKWHLGEFQSEYRPTRRGFEHQYGHWYGALDYFTHLRDDTRDWYRNDEPCDDEGYTTHLLAREACRLIRERQADKPLFLYVPFNAVHSPYQVPEKYLAPYGHLQGQRRTYAGMVAAMDEAIGQIIATLREQGMLEHTLLVFSSDNGGPGPDRITSNQPLRAGKGTIYEGGVRVCACAAWPGHIPAGSTVTEPMHMVDWYPTLLAAAGATPNDKLLPDGVDMGPTLTFGQKPDRDAILLCGMSPKTVALRVGDWKLLVFGEGDEPAEEGAANANARTRRRAAANNPRIELYNLAQDIGEQTNLAETHPEKVRELQARLATMRQDAVAPGGPRGAAAGQSD